MAISTAMAARRFEWGGRRINMGTSLPDDRSSGTDRRKTRSTGMTNTRPIECRNPPRAATR